MKRRLLAFGTALGLLFGILVVPAKAQLVCRMSGQAGVPAPPPRSPAHDVSSCAGDRVPASAAASYDASVPGCCELRPGAARQQLPGVTAPAPPEEPAPATLPVAPFWLTPSPGEARPPAPTTGPAVFRKAPPGSAPPGAPPFPS